MGIRTILAVTGLLAGVAEAAPIQITPVPLSAPSVEITNGLIRTKIYVIDAQKGFYRGQRFHRAGVVGSLTYGVRNFTVPGSTVSHPLTWTIPTRRTAWWQR